MLEYSHYNLCLKFDANVQGGIPKHKDMIEGWLDQKAMDSEIKDEIRKDGIDEEATEKVWCGFLSDEEGLYVPDIHFKSHMKDALSRLNVFVSKRGSKNIVHFGMIIRPDKLRFYDNDGNIIKEPSGYTEAIAHITGPQGRRSALKRNDHIDAGCSMNFHIFIAKPHGKLSKDDLENALSLGQEMGFGTNRTMGYGRYTVTKFEKCDDIKIKLGQHPLDALKD